MERWARPRSTCGPTTTTRRGAGGSARRSSPTCSSTAPRASRSAWPPTFRRTTSTSSAMRRCCTSSSTRKPRIDEAGRVRARARFPDRRRAGRAARRDPRGLSAPAAAASACAPSGRGKTPARGTYQIVVTEIPYQVQKAKLIEKIAELLSEKKLPLLGDVRDESAEDDPPRARAEEPHRRSGGADGDACSGLTRARGPLRAQHERAVGRAGSERADHCGDVLKRVARAPHRGAGAPLAVPAEEDRAPAGSARRLPDRLPQPRRGDPHRPLRGRSEGQADRAHSSSPRCRPTRSSTCACRACRKLEEIEIKGEHDKLSQGAARRCKALLKSDDQQWERIAEEVKATREALLQEDRARPPPHRRSPTRPSIEVDLEQAMIEKEPITVILSDKGWIRALKGHMDDLSKLEFKQGDGLKRAVTRADDRQAAAARHQRQGLHARRPTSCPAVAATASPCA